MMRILALSVSQLVTRKCCQGMFITQLIASYCHLAQSLDPFSNHFIKEAHRIGQGKCNGIDGQPMTNQSLCFCPLAGALVKLGPTLLLILQY